MSQRQLAEQIGATVRSISWWENSDRRPDFVFIARIAQATGQSLDFFSVTE